MSFQVWCLKSFVGPSLLHLAIFAFIISLHFSSKQRRKWKRNFGSTIIPNCSSPRAKTRWNIELTQEEIISSTLHMLLMKYFRFLLSVYKNFKDLLPDRFRYCFLWLKEISFFWQGGAVKRLFNEEPLQILTIWIKSDISHIARSWWWSIFLQHPFLDIWGSSCIFHLETFVYKYAEKHMG